MSKPDQETSAWDGEKDFLEKLRRLGNRAMVDWAGAAEERVAWALREAVPGARVRKKKS